MHSLNANELLAEVDSMPIDLKTRLIEKLLGSLNPTQPSIDDLWKEEIESRLTDIDSGKVDLVDGNEVFRKIQKRLA